SLKDMQDARSVTETLGMPYHIFHYENLFRDEVIEPFVACYERGETPNPCIECNRCFKFQHLYKEMEELGCDVLVTGHYAQVVFDEGKNLWQLRKAVDPAKDQSYVLYTLTQEQLAHTRFPLGGLTKERAREIAEENGFVNAKKHDSQDICFVPDGDYVSFMERFRKRAYPEGDFLDKEGNVMGRHKGYVHYTIGQRKGLGIAYSHPLYVIDIRPEDNTVILGTNEDLFHTRLTARNVNIISGEAFDAPRKVLAKIRYRHTEQPATAYMEGDRLIVEFDEPQRAITRGQAVVLYDGDEVLGGGVICQPCD
ncbi:MAG: tRNA 2-thiouridine(34) synthase MnmA, partial [Lachnospiraceae bacterium]|nr:tRNA 2-thiouridine(34) synthase MnmA [Lachnospiraceae bacterium]